MGNPVKCWNAKHAGNILLSISFNHINLLDIWGRQHISNWLCSISKWTCAYLVLAGWWGSGEFATLVVLAPPWLRSTWKIICWTWKGFPQRPFHVSLMLRDWSSIHNRGSHMTSRPQRGKDLHGQIHVPTIYALCRTSNQYFLLFCFWYMVYRQMAL